MSTAKNTLKVKDEVIQINPGLLFQRLASVAAKFPECLERSLEYELCQFPPSLFASPQCLRQTNKSQLADALKKMINPPNEMMDVDLQYVIDGGSLLHKIPWNKGSTYLAICMQYVDYVKSTYGNPVIVFDGYSLPSVKDMLHRVRNKGRLGVEITFTRDMVLNVSKDVFLLNNHNKQQFINMLSNELVKNHCQVHHSQTDADVLIVEKTVQSSKEYPTALVAEDTDLLVLLLDKVTDSCQNVYMISKQSKKAKGTIWHIQQAQSKLQPDILTNILFIHAFTGCDTTSGIKGIGKSSLMKKINKKKQRTSGICFCFQ